jgi:hypothetical protein
MWKQLFECRTNRNVVVRRTSEINGWSAFIVWQAHLHSVVKFAYINFRKDNIQIFFKTSSIFRQVLWVMTSHDLVGGYRYFGGTYCLLQGQSDPKNGGSLFP